MTKTPAETYSDAVSAQVLKFSAYDDAKEEYAEVKKRKRGKSQQSRRLNLDDVLQGGAILTPQPEIGGARSDGVQLLYPGKWHTIIAPTTAGKSLMAAWHAKAVIEAGDSVMYLHFEESQPHTTIAHLQRIGLTNDQIREQFIWLDAYDSWVEDDMAYELSLLPKPPKLVVLDGVNEACALNVWPVEKPEGVTAYRKHFVHAATEVGAAVLSLGHPTKSKDQKDDIHGFGSVHWLNLADGVGFRLEPSASAPIRKDHRGSSSLFTVKDRTGELNRHATPNDKRPGWMYLGSLVVDDTATGMSIATSTPTSGPATVITLELPSVLTVTQPGRDKYDVLADAIAITLAKRGGRFDSQNKLIHMLRADKVQFSTTDIPTALLRLKDSGRIILDEGATRSGSLVSELDGDSG